jgi:hypothetical protein
MAPAARFDVLGETRQGCQQAKAEAKDEAHADEIP